MKSFRPRLLLFALPLVLAAPTFGAAPERRIEADFTVVKGPNTRVEAFCVGAGRVAELLRAAAVGQLQDVHDNCGFRYLRCHGLFHDELAVYSEDNQVPRYNFQHVDLAYDAILHAGLKPFVELGFMPNELAGNPRTIFWWKASVSTPRDWDRWGDLVRAFVAHVEARYGHEEVKSWFFEVWNEPNLASFFTGTQADYFHLYEVSARAVKSVAADYRVGGPATAGNAWVPELIAFCQGRQVPLDFISTHHYGTRSMLDEAGNKLNTLVPGGTVVADAVAKVRAQIRHSPWPQLPLYFTEWSTSPSSRDPVHDTYFSAAYIVNTLKRAVVNADAMSYWTFTDVFEEAGPAPSPFHGGFGLVNLQGLHKPSYYAYKFLHELGDTELGCADPNATACRGPGSVQILWWDYSQPRQGKEPDNTFFSRPLVPQPVGPAVVVVKHLPAGRYRLQLFGIGDHRNDVLSAFRDQGSPANPTREQVQAMAAESNGAPLRVETVTVATGEEFRWAGELRENDVFLLKLDPI